MAFEDYCFLCLNPEYICVNDIELIEKIHRHLQIQISDEGAINLNICVFCIESLEQFHEYYERVHSIQLSKYNKNHYDDDIKSSDCESGDDETSQFIDEKSDPTYASTSHLSRQKPKLIRNQDKKKKKPSKKSLKLRSIRKKIESFYINVSCPICINPLLFPSFKQLKDHFKDYHDELPFLQCCKKTFQLNDVFGLQRHMGMHADPESCKCDLCGKVLSTPRLMRLHKELHIPISERSYECKECGRKCGGNAELYRHIKTMHTAQDSVCDICGKEFRRRVTFQLHMRTAHGEQKAYVCEICVKAYRTPSGLQRHKHVAHSTNYSPKTKQCELCGKWMGATYLKNHLLRSHHNVKPIECSLCEKTFKLPADLKSHLISHSELRPHQCSECSSSFKTKASLRMHMSQHTGGKTVTCPYCSKVISSNSNYRAHLRRMHVEHLQDDRFSSGLEVEVVKQEEIFCEETVIDEGHMFSEED